MKNTIIRALGLAVSVLLILTCIGCATPRTAPLVAAKPTKEEPKPRAESVTADRLNLRSLPSNHSEIISRLTKGESVNILGAVVTWVKVVTEDGKEGYVYAPGYLTGFTNNRHVSKNKTKHKSTGRAGSSQAKTGESQHISLIPLPGNEEPSTTGASNLQSSPKSSQEVDKKEPAMKSTPSTKKTSHMGMAPASKTLPKQQNVGASEDNLQKGTPRTGASASKAEQQATPNTLKKQHPVPDSAKQNIDERTVAPAAEIADIDIGKSQNTKLLVVRPTPKGELTAILSAPDKKAQILTQVRPGTHLRNYGKKGAWYKTWADGQVGYVNQDSVEQMDLQ